MTADCALTHAKPPHLNHAIIGADPTIAPYFVTD
jgi:hypothetical protein